MPRLPVICMVAAALAPFPLAAAERIKGPVAATVTKVRDGDTLEVRASVWLDHVVEPAVRIDGIDTPEEKGKCDREKALAAQATAFVAEMLANPAVELFDIQHDKYAGRVRARVVAADGRDVAKELVDKGLARRYRGDARQSWCVVGIVPRR